MPGKQMAIDAELHAGLLDAEGRPAVRDVKQGDLWYFPPGLPHSLQGLGATGAEFVLVFDNGHASEFNTLLLNEWMAHTPPEVLAENFDLPVSAFRNIPVDDTWIFQGPTPMPLAEAQAAVRTPLGEPDVEYVFSMNDMKPGKVTRGGEVKIIDARNFPISKTIAAALVTVKPGGLRELHWHPNADEWQYYIAGAARMTVFNTGPKAQTADFHPGDIGVVRKSLGHYVQNTGSSDLVFMEIFKDSEYQEVSLSQWLAGTPPDLLASHLNMDPKLLQKFRTPRVVAPA